MSEDPIRDDPWPLPEVLGYHDDDAVADVALRLIATDPHFRPLQDVRIAFLRRVQKRPERWGPHTAARFVKAPDLWRHLANVDAAIWVASWAWDPMTGHQREALVAHELCHAGIKDDGTLEVHPHDVEEFGWVVERYGAWQPELKEFGAQLALGISGAGPVRQAVRDLTDGIGPDESITISAPGRDPVKLTGTGGRRHG